MLDQRRLKPFVFVLMPFSEEFTDVYESGIKQACRAAKTHCERVDKQNFDGPIIDHVFAEINRADIIVADMTGRNSNVFYEVGYAHSLGKQVIMLTQNAKDIPFDVNQHAHLIYEGKSYKLRKQLTTRLKWCIKNPKPPTGVCELRRQIAELKKAIMLLEYLAEPKIFDL